MSEDAADVVDEQIGRGQVQPDTARAFEEEALRVTGAGKERGVVLRIIGALAFHHHCPQFGYFQAKMNRVYTDIDFAAYAKQSKQIRELFVSLGYDEDVEINSFHAEAGRLIFNNPTSHIHVDVFMDRLDFCHPIPWKGRLEVDYPTIPLAELVLEKMQIVKINEKDIIDTIMLLREHAIATDDDDHVNSDRIAELCAGEWGLWRTTSMNLEKVRDYLPHVFKIRGRVTRPYKLVSRETHSENTVVTVNGVAGTGIPFTVTTASPTITNLSPASATAGGAAFTLTVNGSNFDSSAKVNWNGSPLTTTFVSAAQVTAAVPANLIASAGTASITVAATAGTSGAPAICWLGSMLSCARSNSITRRMSPRSPPKETRPNAIYAPHSNAKTMPHPPTHFPKARTSTEKPTTPSDAATSCNSSPTHSTRWATQPPPSPTSKPPAPHSKRPATSRACA